MNGVTINLASPWKRLVAALIDGPPAMIWLLSLALLSLSACARPLPVTGSDPIIAVMETTPPPPPSTTPTITPLATPTLTPAPTVTATPSPSPDPTPVRLSLTSLQNLSYPLYSQEGWQVPLKDGVYDSGDNADFPVHVEIEGSPLLGDVNGDGVEDAVVLLYTQAAASGQFHDLVFVLNRNGEPKVFKSIFLGDDVTVESITISPEGVTTVTILSRNPEGGTQEKVRQYGPFKD